MAKTLERTVREAVSSKSFLACDRDAMWHAAADPGDLNLSGFYKYTATLAAVEASVDLLPCPVAMEVDADFSPNYCTPG